MTGADHPHRGGVDPAVARALDRFDVPPPSDAFLARVVAIAETGPPMSLATPFAPRWKDRLQRRGRGPWVRRTAIGLIAVGLASATAAAAGMFEAVRFEIPVIAQLLTPTPQRPPVTSVAQAKPRPARVNPAAPDPIMPAAEANPLAPPLLTPAERAERFRALPMPVRAVVTERMVTRTQRRLAARGVFVPRAIVRDRVVARTGQTDLPSGTPAERRAQVRAAVIAAPPGSLPPRLERWRARLVLQQSGIGAGRGATNENSSVGSSDVVSAVPPGVQVGEAREAWRALRADQIRRWRARVAERAASGVANGSLVDPGGERSHRPATAQPVPATIEQPPQEARQE